VQRDVETFEGDEAQGLGLIARAFAELENRDHCCDWKNEEVSARSEKESVTEGRFDFLGKEHHRSSEIARICENWKEQGKKPPTSEWRGL
jgi:hypothetical protein